MNKPVKIFISYAREDEAYKDKLQTSLAILQREGFIDTWDDRQILGGQVWDDKIKAALDAAQIILLLVSADFLASAYIFDVEIKHAMEKHHSKKAIVVPIILRSCLWEIAEFNGLTAFPKDGLPVGSWEDEDEAFFDIVSGIKQLIEPTTEAKVNKEPSAPENDQTLLTEAIKHIGDGELKDAFDKVDDYCNRFAPGQKNGFVGIKSDYSFLQKDIIAGVVLPEQKNERMATINKNLISFIDKLQSR